MLPFSRRLVSQFLLFSLVSLVATGLGVYLTATGFHSPHLNPDDVQLLHATAEALHEDLEVHGGKNVQQLVDRAAIAGRLRFCAVVRDGHAVSHSNHEQIGQPLSAPQPRDEGHVVERSHHPQIEAVPIVEYAVSLTPAGQPESVLMFSAAAPPPRSSLWRLLEAAPPVILLPMLLVTIGGRMIGRSVDAYALIERRLLDVASSPELTPALLEPIVGPGELAQGWNRLVAHLRTAPAKSSTGDSVLSGMQSFRDKQLERALHALPEAFVMTDADGRIRLANPALAGLLNAPPESIRGANLLELLPGIAPDAVNGLARLRTDRSRPVVVEMPRAEEISEGCLRVARYPLDAEGSAPADHVWLIRDVTQQKLAERARDEFVAAATHELRTPLTNIQAYSETLSLHDIDDVEQRKTFLNTINQEATRLARFVDELLSISRMEAGAMALTKQQTDLLRLFQEVAEKVRPSMEQKNLHFEVAIPTKLPEQKLDKDKVTAALVNLLGNAAKYTAENGNVSLKVEVEQSTLVVHVQDSGYGMSAEDVARLGSRFFRSSDPRVQQATGTGLGLAFTMDVFRLHGGRMTVQSELNKGSTFTVTLPLTGL